MQAFNQYLLNKKDDTCPLLDTNIYAWIELSIWRRKRCHVHSMVKFVSTHDYLIPTMRLHSWTSVTLRRLYIGQFLSLHFQDRNEDFLSKGSKDILHDNKILSCTMELPNESASLVVIFVLFSFGTNLWLHVLSKNTGKAFIDMTKINCLVTTLYEVFNKLQAFLYFFFSFFGNQRGNQKKTHFALFGCRSEHRFSCSLAGPTTTYK